MSTAQQASSKVIGNIEPVRAQLISASTEVTAKPCCTSGLSPSGRRMSSTRPTGSGLCKNSFTPIPARPLPFVDETDHQDAEKYGHRQQCGHADLDRTSTRLNYSH